MTDPSIENLTPHTNDPNQVDVKRVAITVDALINGSLDRVWTFWTEPEHITQWNFASPDWHCPAAVNDLRAGGSFDYTMASRDGQFQFSFAGVYSDVSYQEQIRSTLGDGRQIIVRFQPDGLQTRVTETFEAEQENAVDLQRDGWQAILNQFKRHVET